MREFFKRMKSFIILMVNKIKLFFTSIDWSTLGSSAIEVLWLTIFALLPFTIHVFITGVSINNLLEAFKSKIIPGEFLSYCFGFLAPTLYLFLVKRFKTAYKLPFLPVITMVVLFVYVANVVLYLIVKNKWVPEINMEHHRMDVYFQLVVWFLTISILFRLYTVYHGKRILNYPGEREHQQELVNRDFANRLNRAQ